MSSFILVFPLTRSFPQPFPSQFVSALSFQLLGSKTSNSSPLIPPSRSQSPHPIHQQVPSALFSENSQNSIPAPATCCFHGECLSISCDPSLRTSLFSRFCPPIIHSVPDTVNHLHVIQSRGSHSVLPLDPHRTKGKSWHRREAFLLSRQTPAAVPVSLSFRPWGLQLPAAGAACVPCVFHLGNASALDGCETPEFVTFSTAVRK